MSNAIIRQHGTGSLVADNVWVFRLGAVPVLAGLGLGILGVAVAAQARRTHAVRPVTPRGWPVTFIHRGGAAVVPEDTLDGFREGLRYGPGVVECDVHSTVDGELVVMHDQTVDRTTEASGPINRLTYAEVRALDAGYRFTTDDGATYPWRGRGVQVPSLAEIFEAFPDLPVNVEIKLGGRDDIEQRVTDAIAAAGAQARTIVNSQSTAVLRRFRRVSRGEVATGAARSELIVFWLASLLHLTRLLDPPYQAVQPPLRLKGVVPVVTRSFVRQAHRLGLRVDVWTVDEEADMRRLLGYGVDGIMTDRPDVLARVLGRGADSLG